MCIRDRVRSEEAEPDEEHHDGGPRDRQFVLDERGDGKPPSCSRSTDLAALRTAVAGSQELLRIVGCSVDRCTHTIRILGSATLSATSATRFPITVNTPPINTRAMTVGKS